MSGCCTNTCEMPQKPAETRMCPACGERGKAVDLITLKSLLIPEALKRIKPTTAYRFCKTPHCLVVYFDSDGTETFKKKELMVRVFQKETANPLPVCYCFGFSRKKIAQEIAQTGKSTVQEEITHYVKEGKCACELRNPQGSCCLGNVMHVVEEHASLKRAVDSVVKYRVYTLNDKS